MDCFADWPDDALSSIGQSLIASMSLPPEDAVDDLVSEPVPAAETVELSKSATSLTELVLYFKKTVCAANKR